MSRVEAEDFVALVHWFVKLTDPVDLDPGTSFSSAPESASNHFARVSVMARQLERPDRSIDDYDDARAAALEALPGTSEVEGSSRLLRPVTVLELVAQFQPGVEPSEAEISDAFDLGMDVVDRLLTSYSLVTKDPIRMPRRESLPPMIPMFTRRVVGDDQGFPGSEGMFVVSASSLRSSHMPEVEPAVWEAATQHFSQSGFEFASYVEARLAGFRSLDRDGDYRAALLAFATACEILLDDLLSISYGTRRCVLRPPLLSLPTRAAERFPDLEPNSPRGSRAIGTRRVRALSQHGNAMWPRCATVSSTRDTSRDETRR